MIELRESDLERFWSKIDKRGRDECWTWTATIGGGVPRLYLAGKTVSGLRIMWQIHNEGELRGGLNVLRSCKNSRCINPRHFVTAVAGTRLAQVGRRRVRRRPGIQELADWAGFDLVPVGEGRYRVVRRGQDAHQHDVGRMPTSTGGGE